MSILGFDDDGKVLPKGFGVQDHVKVKTLVDTGRTIVHQVLTGTILSMAISKTTNNEDWTPGDYNEGGKLKNFDLMLQLDHNQGDRKIHCADSSQVTLLKRHPDNIERLKQIRRDKAAGIKKPRKPRNPNGTSKKAAKKSKMPPLPKPY